jgi:hypothetical protein
MSITSMLQYMTSFIPGSRLVDGGDCLTLAQQVVGVKAPLTALAGGGQVGATGCNCGLNLVTIAGAGGTDSVALPLAVPGVRVIVQNDSLNAIQVFGQASNPNTLVGDTIAAYNSSTYEPTATGVTQAASTVTEYYCAVAGKWKQGQT